MELGLVCVGCFLEESMEHVVRIQHCRVWRFVNWGWAEQAGEKLGGQGAPVPTVLLLRFSVWVVRTILVRRQSGKLFLNSW